MTKTIQIEITLTNLTDKLNHHGLVVELETEIENAVSRALNNQDECDASGSASVPEF